MRVSEVMMRSPITCSRITSLRNATRMLREHDIGFLLVVEELWNRSLMGVVTDRDLCLTGSEWRPYAALHRSKQGTAASV
ncbi:MAG: CBS domain-containing protein [Acidobacteriia bacterium]|nr:CBS domain-containing protein [Terriglobia bacterium]